MISVISSSVTVGSAVPPEIFDTRAASPENRSVRGVRIQRRKRKNGANAIATPSLS